MKVVKLNMNETILSVKSMRRGFIPDKQVLTNITFDLSAQEILLITGANGIGKTTLLKVLAALIDPDDGSISICGLPHSGESKYVRSLIGYVPAAESSFFSRLTGLENLEFFARLQKVPESEFYFQIENWKKIPPFLQAIKTPYFQCSSGMKQLLSIFRALAHRPKLVLLDEPTRSLDKETSAIVRKIISDYVSDEKVQAAAIIVSHLPEEIQQFGTRVCELRGGCLA